eukprot:6958807-Lingulodinium_polyedra.AAC.1
MTTLPVALQSDWAFELIGSIIKYPFAAEIFVEVVSSVKPDYSAKQLVGVLLGTIVRAAPQGQ